MRQEPQRPYLTEKERENQASGDDKDHLDAEPGSDEMVTTGETEKPSDSEESEGS